MKKIAVALIVLVAVAGVAVFWPPSKTPETTIPADPRAAPDETGASSPQPASMIMRPGAESISGKGMAIKLGDLSNLDAGEVIALYLPQEDSIHEGVVTDVSTTPSGNQVVTGFLDGQHRFVFTIGQFQTFATIQTQAGRYQLEAREGSGRIVSVKTINDGLDFSQPDYVVPERKIPSQDKPTVGEEG